MNLKHLLIVAIIAVALGCLYFIFGRGEEAVLKGRLQELISTLEKEQGESVIQSAVAARNAASFFVESPSVYVSGYNVRAQNRDDIQTAVMGARNSLDSIRISLTSFEATVEESKNSAITLVKVKVNISGSSGADQGSGGYRLEWIKEDGNWLIDRVEPTQ